MCSSVTTQTGVMVSETLDSSVGALPSADYNNTLQTLMDWDIVLFHFISFYSILF